MRTENSARLDRHDEAKEGYESVTISDGNTRKTEFEVTMKNR